MRLYINGQLINSTRLLAEKITHALYILTRAELHVQHLIQNVPPNILQSWPSFSVGYVGRIHLLKKNIKFGL